MLPEVVEQNGDPVNLRPVTITKNDNRLPGSVVLQRKNKVTDLTIQQFGHSLFSIGYRILRFFQKRRITIREKDPGIRMEAVLEGRLTEEIPGENKVIHAGQYRLTDRPEIKLLFEKNSACHYFITHYSDALLEQIGVKQLVQPSPVKPITQDMRTLIQKILHNPYQDRIQEFHYDNCIRELLLLHLTSAGEPLPGHLSDADLTAIFTADSILQKDLTLHQDIPTIATQAGINEFKLKIGFRQLFNMGVFERLTFHRMQQAKLLLSTTHRTIDDIASLVGYSSRNSFITAFKKNFAITPKQWKRKSARGD